MALKRYLDNPIITRRDIPAVSSEWSDVSSVFNPGAVYFQERILLMLRVQNRGRETCFMLGRSSSGSNFNIQPSIVQIEGLDSIKEPIYHIYDPRITELEGRYYIMVAMDMDSGCRLGLIRTDDFEKFEFLGVVSKKDNRNGVLFPEKIGGRYLRMDRPNRSVLKSGVTSGDTIMLSESEDLLHWKQVAPVISGRHHYWDERIGSGPPPVKTKEGWLHLYHGIATHFSSVNIYQAGALLLDLKDPTKVIARTRYNLLEPREMYEMAGQVPNVVFPSGMIVKWYDDDGYAELDSSVLVYYGAADTSVCLATSTVRDIIEDCYA